MNDAAEILGVTYATLARHLNKEDLNLEGLKDFVEIKGKKS